MVKFLFLDIDGTLLTSQKELSDRTINTLTKAYKNGYKISLSSGRCIDGLKDIIIKLPFPVIKSSLNGAYIVSDIDRLLYEDYFSPNDVKCFYELASRVGVELMFFSGYTWGTETYNQTHIREEHVVRHKGFVKKLDTLLMEDNIHKLLACGSDDKCYEFLNHAKKLFPSYEIVSSSAIYVEINKPGVNKGAAIKKIVEAYNSSIDNVIVFGDHDNDIEAFKVAKRSVAMANSSETIKKLATDMTLSNDEDGVAVFIENNLL